MNAYCVKRKARGERECENERKESGYDESEITRYLYKFVNMDENDEDATNNYAARNPKKRNTDKSTYLNLAGDFHRSPSVTFEVMCPISMSLGLFFRISSSLSDASVIGLSNLLAVKKATFQFNDVKISVRE